MSTLKVFRDWRLLEQHPSFIFWVCFAPAWYLLPKGYFLEFGVADDPVWWQLYYIWDFSADAAFVAMACTFRRYFMIVLAPIMIYSLICLGVEVHILIGQLDPNGPAVLDLKQTLLRQCGFCCLFCLILLQLFPWESLHLRTGR